MGVMARVLDFVFGGNRLQDTVELFRENADAGAERAHMVQTAAMAQFGQEFLQGRRGRFDRIMDGVNRLPRPLMAMGCLGLFVSAMADPVWFAARMQGIRLVPEPLWWLLGVIVSFYFGARHQTKGQEFQKSLAASLAQMPRLAENLEALIDQTSPAETEANQALDDWLKNKAA